MNKFLGDLLWAAVSILAAICLGAIAICRGEHINSIWLVVAAACTYLRRLPLLRASSSPRA